MTSCVFCEIVDLRAPATFLPGFEPWSSQYPVVAFQPLKPATIGHMLFVPRDHIEDATVSPPLTALTTARAAEYARDFPAANIITSIGKEATQSVFHLHVHVVPRGPKDRLPQGWPWRGVVSKQT